MDINLEYEVCICITNFNKALYIEEALKSAVSQKFNGKFHIIIVDDCSNDNSRGIISSYQNKYPQLITAYFNISNLGLINNFIKISKLSKGKYVAFLDSDDYWTDEFKIQKQVNLIQNDNSVGMVHTNHLTVNEDKVLGRKVSVPSSGYVYNKLILNNFITHSTVLIRRNLLVDTIEKLEKLSWEKFYYNDYPVYLMISIEAKIEYLNEKTMVYRNLGSSASHTKNYDLKTRIVDSTFYSRIYFIDNIKAVPSKIKNKIKSKYFYSKLVIATSNTQTDNFFKLMFQFYKHCTSLKYLMGSFIQIFKLLYLKYFNISIKK